MLVERFNFISIILLIFRKLGIYFKIIKFEIVSQKLSKMKFVQ